MLVSLSFAPPTPLSLCETNSTRFYSLYLSLCRLPYIAVTSEHKDVYVPISREAVIRTYVSEPTETGIDTPHYPLVMIHGFGAGFLQFYKNLDHLHDHRRLLAMDVPGFGRSTRIPFATDARTAEEEMVGHLETWRQVMGLKKFILLGHSLGAFLACSYTISHPDRVQHLILVDPWGLSPPLSEEETKKRFPFLAKKIWQMFGRMKPFDTVRLAGPWGEQVDTTIATVCATPSFLRK